jgi:hypothetical protein
LIGEQKYCDALQHLAYAQEFGASDPKVKKLLREVLRRIQIPPVL